MKKVFSDGSLISLIIPVYNAVPYLRTCMGCVLNQSYPNYEVLLVDDGSDDGSGKACDDYASKDSRIRAVHHEANKGLSAARNTGLSHARGEYIAFMDADDEITPDYLEKLYLLCVKFGVPLSACNHLIVRGERVRPRFPVKGESFSLTERTALENILYQDVPDVSAWGKLYRRDILQGIVYPEGKLYEDTARIAEIITAAGEMAYTDEPLYRYNIGTASLSHGAYTPNRWDYIDAVEHMTEVTLERYPALKDACICERVYAAMSVRRFFADSSGADEPTKNKLDRYIRENAGTVLFSKRTPKRNKLGVCALLLGSGMYDAGWRFYEKRRNPK